jgi:predicted phage baseplate assembly protein
MNVCCPCDELVHPGKPVIAAGLPALPRQLAGLPEYRLAMLRDIPLHLPLSGWRAREGDDLGVMLLEMWAYVLDILGFYDERIANETYLRPAVLRPSVRKLVELIGYQPRPALGASVILATIADGNKLVKLPPRTGFRSGPFDGEPSQVFETEVEHTIHPLKNQWRLGPVREKTVGDRLFLEADTARLARDQLAVFVWPAPRRTVASTLATAFRVVERPSLKTAAGRVVTAKAVEGRDGQTYIEVDVEPAFQIEPGVRLADVRIFSPSQSAPVTALLASGPSLTSSLTAVEVSQLSAQSSFVESSVAHAAIAQAALQSQSGTDFTSSLENISSQAQRSAIDLPASVVRLDAVYRDIQKGNLIVISRGSEFRTFTVVDASENQITVFKQGEIEVKVPMTELEVFPSLPGNWRTASRSLTVHFNMLDAGRLTRSAKTLLNTGDFALPGALIDQAVEPIPESVAPPSKLLLRDAVDNGLLVDGTVQINADGEGRVQLGAETLPFAPSLRTPVSVFGNLVAATRGESVLSEVIGSSDTAQSFQSFTLGNKPLTYFNDPAAPAGRRSTLEVRVNGIKWKEVQSFFGARPQDEVYIVRQNDDGESVITFGDGITGTRPPTGADNITASYRFGAGAPKPPAGGISQLAKPVEGLRRVINPVGAGGGADADQPKDIRRNAPNSALILGRAVSVPDFQALALEFGGVINAHVEWAWDELSQRAVVMVSFISDGGDIAKELRAFLIGQADPNTPLVAVEAHAQPSQLVIDLGIDPRFTGEIVVPQVIQALTNPDSGILALENIPIGRPLFRSRIFDVVLSVEGTRSVRAMTVDGQPAPFAITVGQDHYRNFLDGLVVGSSRDDDSLVTH